MSVGEDGPLGAICGPPGADAVAVKSQLGSGTDVVG